MTLAGNERISARSTVASTAFFDAYRRHDVEAMVDLCSENADFEYVPFEMWGRQRVMRGAGKVATVGKPLWTGMIQAFPDLTNSVRSLTADEDGNVAAEVVISGTQSGAWGTIANRGQSYSEPHLFVLHVGSDGLIDAITGYWDGASISRQLGHLEVD